MISGQGCLGDAPGHHVRHHLALRHARRPRRCAGRCSRRREDAALGAATAVERVVPGRLALGTALHGAAAPGHAPRRASRTTRASDALHGGTSRGCLNALPPRQAPSSERARHQPAVRVQPSPQRSAAASSSPWPRPRGRRCRPQVLPLPERRPGLQVVHQEFRRLEGGARDGRRRSTTRTMCSPGQDRPKRWMTVTPVSGQRAARLLDDPRELGFRHAGIVLEFQGGEPAALVPAQAREGRRPRRYPLRPSVSDATPRASKSSAARSKSCPPGLRDGRALMTVAHPPVMGGKKAISRAPAMEASGFTWVWSIAARTTPRSRRRRHIPRRGLEPRTRSATVATRPAGRPLRRSCRPARAPRRNRRASPHQASSTRW